MPGSSREIIANWAWPDERQSWTWSAAGVANGTVLDVNVYTQCDSVQLLLNGVKFGKPQQVQNRLTAFFKVPYAPGHLTAIGMVNNRSVASKTLSTAGPPHTLRLSVDRATITASRNDLAYVTIDVIDAAGVVCAESAASVAVTVAGPGELAAMGSGDPTGASSFHAGFFNAYRGHVVRVCFCVQTHGRVCVASCMRP